MARSKSGVLSAGSRSPGIEGSKIISTGVTECISVDSVRKRAYISVQSRLVEVDLETLLSVTQEIFPSSITTLSEARHPIPVTVGTNTSLYLHDPRATGRFQSSSANDHVDAVGKFGIQALTSSELLVSGYAPLYQPESPLTILHMPATGNESERSSDIYVAGRFPSILNYEYGCICGYIA